MEQAQQYLEDASNMLAFSDFAIKFEMVLMVLFLILVIAILLIVNKVKRNSDYILKMKIYEFEKNNPEKPFTEIINETRAYVRVKF